MNKVEERAQRIYKYNDTSVKQQAEQIRKMELTSSGLLQQKLSQQKRMQIKQRLHAITSESVDDGIHNKIQEYKRDSIGDPNGRFRAS